MLWRSFYIKTFWSKYIIDLHSYENFCSCYFLDSQGGNVIVCPSSNELLFLAVQLFISFNNTLWRDPHTISECPKFYDLFDVVGETEICDVYEERTYADCVDQNLKVNLSNFKNSSVTKATTF